MERSLVEMLPEVVELLVFGVGSVALSLAGAYLERVALLTVESGQSKLGAWIGFVGLMAFVFAYLLATDKFRASLARFRAER
jgi:hypothetical protein